MKFKSRVKDITILDDFIKVNLIKRKSDQYREECVSVLARSRKPSCPVRIFIEIYNQRNVRANRQPLTSEEYRMFCKLMAPSHPASRTFSCGTALYQFMKDRGTGVAMW